MKFNDYIDVLPEWEATLLKKYKQKVTIEEIIKNLRGGKTIYLVSDRGEEMGWDTLDRL